MDDLIKLLYEQDDEVYKCFARALKFIEQQNESEADGDVN